MHDDIKDGHFYNSAVEVAVFDVIMHAWKVTFSSSRYQISLRFFFTHALKSSIHLVILVFCRGGGVGGSW